MGDKFETLARAGYAARGAVYILLGILALSSVFWGMGQEPSAEGAMATLLGQPFGRVLLGLVAIGLIGHVLWRLAQALLDADRKRNDLRGWGRRIGNFSSGIGNGALALQAAQMALGLGRSGGEGQSEDGAAAWLMQQQPFGPWFVGAVGLVIVGAGGVQVWRGLSGKYRERLIVPPARRGILHFTCALGLLARGLLFAVIGGFLVYAAMRVDPQQGSLTEALDWVRGLPFGLWLYGLAALGLLAFGVYSPVLARYCHVEAPSGADIKRAMPGNRHLRRARRM